MGISTTQISLSTGQRVNLEPLTGTVADDRHSSSIRVFSEGGGGHVGPNGGFVEAPQIHSVTTTYQSIWISDAKGVDHEVAIQNMNVPLRVGHRVTVYLAQPEGSNGARYEALFNHSTRLSYNWARDIPPAIRLTQGYRGSAIATVLVVGSLMVWGTSWVRLDQIETQARNLRTRTPDCRAPHNFAWTTKAERVAAEKAFAECKANLPAIWVEYRNATAAYTELNREANAWVFARIASIIALLIGGLIRWMRRSGYKTRVLQEYLDKLDAIVGTGNLI